MSDISARRPAERWARLRLLVATTTILASACGGGGGGPSDGPPAPPQAPAPASTVSMSLAADSAGTTPGGSAIHVHADIQNSTEYVAWSLEGPGSLSASTGKPDIVYTPPGLEDYAEEGKTIRVTAWLAFSNTRQSIGLSLGPSAVPGHIWATARQAARTWSSVAYGDGNFVAVDQDGAIYLSADGRTWTPRETGVPIYEQPMSVVWGDAGWLVVTFQGSTLTSPDAIAWTYHPRAVLAQGATSGNFLSRAIDGGGRYVVSGPGVVATSLDGLSWSRSPAPPSYSIAYGEGIFAALADTPVYSTDALVWTASSGPAMPNASIASGANIAYGAGQFVASLYGEMQTSADGLLWTAPTAAPELTTDVAFVDDRFFAFRGAPVFGQPNADLWQSFDGHLWDRVVQNDDLHIVTGIAGHGGTFVRVSSMGSIGVSNDARAWTDVVDTSIGDLQGVDSMDDRWVAVSNLGWSLTSTDGKRWARAGRLAPDVPGGAFDARAVTHGGGVFVAAGALSWLVSDPSQTSGAISFSSDGQRWTLADVPAGAPTIRGLVHDGKRFVAVGEAGAVLASDDGRAWSQVGTVPGQPTLNAVAHGGDRYVAVGDAGVIATSADGASWSVSPTIVSGTVAAPVNTNLHAVVFDGTRFFLAGGANGQNGVIASSTDGFRWQATSDVYQPEVYAIAVGGGETVALDYVEFLSSRQDSDHWTPRYFPSPTPQNFLRAVAYGNGRFVAVGDKSVVLTSDH